jgi:AcrR family transcriptional regulator
MSGLREKKKCELREKILTVSKEVFFTKGYSNATMNEIAQNAGIGVGTIYNFFKTKADILINVVAEEVGAGAQDYHLEDADIKKGVRDIVVSFSWQFFGKMRYLGKTIWKELFAATFSMKKSDSRLFKGLSSMDFKYIEKLNALLLGLREKHILAANFDTEAASMAVYSIFLTQFLLYVYNDAMTFEQLRQDVGRQVGFIFGESSNTAA